MGFGQPVLGQAVMARHKRPEKGDQFVSPTGRSRFTVERFLSDCCEETRTFLVKQWGLNNVLNPSTIPVDGLPPVIILAAYARTYEVDLTTDYDYLIDRYQERMSEVCHPDKYLCSCIVILHGRGQFPGDEAFEAINIPNIYEELI